MPEEDEEEGKEKERERPSENAAVKKTSHHSKVGALKAFTLEDVAEKLNGLKAGISKFIKWFNQAYELNLSKGELVKYINDAVKDATAFYHSSIGNGKTLFDACGEACEYTLLNANYAAQALYRERAPVMRDALLPLVLGAAVVSPEIVATIYAGLGVFTGLSVWYGVTETQKYLENKGEGDRPQEATAPPSNASAATAPPPLLPPEEPDNDSKKSYKTRNFEKDDNVGLERFTKRLKNNVLEDPKTKQRLVPDQARSTGGGGHGGSHWKLLDREGSRIGTISKDGRWLRK